MKRYLLTPALSFISLFSFAQNDSPRDISTIDAQDTVVFDLSQAVEATGYVEFPVRFLSNDTVNAVDFSMKFNHLNFAYDTIIKLASYLSITSNYNASDSTLYFTSFSIQRITNDTPLVKVRFNILSGQLCSSDLSSVIAYLNGDVCSVKIINCIPNGIFDIDVENNSLDVYPNPADGLINVSFNSGKTEKCRLVVSDITGKVIYENQLMTSVGLNNLHTNLDFLSVGIYQVQVVSPTLNFSRKIVLQ